MARRYPLHREVIVVEGYTEAAYLERVRDWDASRQFEAQPIIARGQGAVIPVLRRQRLDAYDTVWIVIDAERHPHGGCRRVQQHVSGSARYRLVITAPMIETWLLAHYQVPTGEGFRDQQILRVEHGYDSKRKLPADFDVGAWRSADERLRRLAARRPSECPLCVPQSGMPELVARLRGVP